MYPVSAGYKLAISQPNRTVRIQGTITLKNNTVINVDDDDFVQGSLYIDERCVSGEDLEIGNVYASELGAVLSMPIANPYSLDGARINLRFGIDLGGGTWEEVPLGIYYVYEIERTGQGVSVKALDGMILFDRDYSGATVNGSPYTILLSLCTKAGVTLATTQADIQAMPNGTASLSLGAEEKVKTCRDVLMWVCQLLGAFARMNRSGALEIVSVSRRTAVKPIFKQHRFDTKISDFNAAVTGLAMEVNGEKISVGTPDMMMTLEENPYLVGQGTSIVQAFLSNILGQVDDVVYTPCDISFSGDPALQAGDWVVVTETGRVGGDAAITDMDGDYYLMAQMISEENLRGALVFVTHSTWRYRGGHQVKSVGKANIGRNVQNQVSKAVQSVAGLAREAYDVATAASEAAELINNAIQGYVLIRQKNGSNNEILIMDNPNPAQAVKVWRWNMGGLGYSDNCTGVDNPNRQYTVAMTMNGAINADFLKVGSILTNLITIRGDSNFYWSGDSLYIVNPSNSLQQIRINKNGIMLTTNGGSSWSTAIGFSGVYVGPNCNFATGYDPSTKETPSGAQAKVDSHNSLESPHNLPSYCKMQNDGIRVYDENNNLRCHLGQYASGQYGLKILNGEIYATSIKSGTPEATSQYIQIDTGGYLRGYGQTGKVIEISTGNDQGNIKLYDAGTEKAEMLLNGAVTRELWLRGKNGSGILLDAYTGESIALGPYGGQTDVRGITHSGRFRYSILPYTTETADLGSSNYKWYRIYGKYVYQGDICFTEKSCAICEKEFKVGDAISLVVIDVDDDGVRSIPIHQSCVGISKTIEIEVPEMTVEHELDEATGEIRQIVKPKLEEVKVTRARIKKGYELDKQKGLFKHKKTGKTVNKEEVVEYETVQGMMPVYKKKTIKL